MNPRYVRSSFDGYRLIDLPTGNVLASAEDDVSWTSFLRSQVRAVLEREGRERAATLAVVKGDVFEDDGSPVHEPTTGEDLVIFAFDEPWPNPHEPGRAVRTTRSVAAGFGRAPAPALVWRPGDKST